MAASPRDRLAGLDALRGLAALAVVAFHFTTRFGMIFRHPSPLPFSVPWGQRGVEVFFAISGFAIARSVERATTVREFLRSRAVRLYPTFWAALAVTFVVVRVFGLPERAVSLREALVNLTMIPASLGAREVDAVYWTLERELRFYGLVAVLIALGARRYTLHVLVATVALQTAGALSHAVPHRILDLLNGGWAHLLAGGALVAHMRRSPSFRTFGWLLVCVLSGRALGRLPFAYGTLAIALVWLASSPRLGGPLGPLTFLGKISYPLFLVHQYVGYVVMRELYARSEPPAVAILCATAAGLAAGAALHFAVEEPCLAALRRRRRESATGPGSSKTTPA